jgi:hypothetical protein
MLTVHAQQGRQGQQFLSITKYTIQLFGSRVGRQVTNSSEVTTRHGNKTVPERRRRPVSPAVFVYWIYR